MDLVLVPSRPCSSALSDLGVMILRCKSRDNLVTEDVGAWEKHWHWQGRLHLHRITNQVMVVSSEDALVRDSRCSSVVDRS